MIGST